MSDYFGALMRSAGVVAPATAGRAPAQAAGASGEDDILEQDIEVEPGMPAEHSDSHAQPQAHDPAEPTVHTADESARDPDAQLGPQAQSPPVASRDPAHAAAPVVPVAPASQLDKHALAHPTVQAALRWVAADPQVVPAPAAADKESRTPLRPTAQRADAPRHRSAPATTPADSRGAVEPAVEPRIGPVPQAARTSTIDLSLPAAPRLRDAAATSPPRPAEAAIDVHIGTIHVTVDAPSQRVVAQPAPQPATRPQPAPPMPDRSGFSRLRLPRL